MTRRRKPPLSNFRKHIEEFTDYGWSVSRIRGVLKERFSYNTTSKEISGYIKNVLGKEPVFGRYDHYGDAYESYSGSRNSWNPKKNGAL